MSVRKLQPNFNTFYYITFTCFQWIPFFEITNLYGFIYKCFDKLREQEIYNCGYVIMPNHLHILAYCATDKEIINNIIGETKRFLAYEIVKRLRKLERNDLLILMQASVASNERRKKKKHNVFQPSLDIKEIVTENFIRQKLNYIHKNPVSGKWKLVTDYIDYVHSSARFYELGEKGIANVYHYQELLQTMGLTPAEFPAMKIIVTK